MIYRSYTPRLPLDRFIARFWTCADAPPHTRERILPSGTIELVIDLRDDEIRIYDRIQPDRCTRFSGGVVSGPYSRFFVIDTLQHASIIGVHFRPAGAGPFLGVPADELADRHIDLDDLWGAQARDLRDRLCAAATPERRFALLEEVFSTRLRRYPDQHRAVRFALRALEHAGPETKVRDIARYVGLSHRRFIQVFGANVGMTPKRYHRVRRFQRALDLVRNAPSPDWSRVALASGYFDQSHMIRDFSAFSGLSPAGYTSRRTDDVMRHHLPHDA